MDQIEDLHESRAPIIIGVVTMLLSITSCIVGARVYTRAFLIHTMGADDWMAIVSLLMIISCGFCVAWNTVYGFAKHVYILTPEQIALYLRTFYVSIVFYNVSLTCVKLTFLLQYYRALGTKQNRRLILIAGAIVVSWSVSQVFVQIFICTPVSAFWEGGGKCIPNIPQWYINAGGNILTDIMILLLPLPIIWQLKLVKGQKFILVGIFCLGFFTCALSIFRIKFLRLTEDFTWDNVESAAWSIAELSSGIICACLPTLRPLLGKVFPRLGASGSRSNPSKNGYGYGSSRDAHSSIKRQSRHPLHQDSQEDMYISSLRDTEKGFFSRRTTEWSELSDGNSETLDAEIEMKTPARAMDAYVVRPVLTTECTAGEFRPKVPPKDFRIQVDRDIVQYSSPSSAVRD
ncbi:hypothetical protein jhhlp_007760 [Lomentospora prolificans]|uniref:Rhodopsin domain-containing protein n=1 Tax=Lomentospora prolificans TaxID=41688 RepID=A0A2N3N0H2_9PEZI|nr:hypothetical protein jhhlp_007760 [Lomentospora prolificans]